MLTILGAVGELERSMIIERTKAGMRNAKTHGTKSGVRIGRPNVIDHELVRQQLAAGTSKMRIATDLKISVDTVRRIERAA
jgi:putative DNA-invertase from lambdoid prophage Rac